MQVAILVDRNRLIGADADDSLGLVGQIYADTTLLGLDIDEADVVLGGHRMRYAAHLNLDMTIIHASYHRNMLLVACIDGIWHKFLHLLATANHRDLRVHHFLNYIATMRAKIKFHSHTITKF